MKVKTGQNKVTHPRKTCDDGVPSALKILYPLPPGLFTTKAINSGGRATKPGELLEQSLYAACRKIFDQVSNTAGGMHTVGEENLVVWIINQHIVRDGRWYLKLNDIELQGGDSGSKLLETIDGKRHLCLDAEIK
jgi:hypothetical protein